MKQSLRVPRVGAAIAAGLSGLLGPWELVHAQLCPVNSSHEDPALGEYFNAYDVVGTFVMLDVRSGTCFLFDPDRASRRFLPASTFKIFNGMTALDEGSIDDVGTILKWDGVDRGSAGWNEDQDMRTAFRRSTVWFYQELARRTGEERMRYWLEREHYGNADPSGGIDRFWLDGALRISAEEQVEFLRRLITSELGFSPRAQEVGRDLLIMERTDDYILAGKTGWTQYEGRHLGWYVGFVERHGGTYIYALNFDSANPDFPMRKAREALLRQILVHLELLSPPGSQAPA